MNFYHCPYCSPKHQLHIQGKHGILICSNCGDPLIRKKLFKLNRVISLIAAVTFVIPLLLVITSIFNNPNQNAPRQDRYSLSIATSFDRQLILST